MHIRPIEEQQSAIDLIALIKNLAPEITTLDLSEKDLGLKETEEILSVLTAIPAHVTSLNLSCNYFGEKNIDEIIKILTALPKTVTNLDLGGNFYNKPEKETQEKIFAAIPSHVRSLSLVKHNFGEDGQDLAKAFMAFSPNLSDLDLFFTGLDTLSLENLKHLKNSLPYLQVVCLSHTEILRMGPERVGALQDIFPNIKEIILLNDQAEPIATHTLLERTNLLKKLGFKVNVPSLVNQCAFFIKKDIKSYDTASLPVELQKTVNSFFPL